MKLDERAAQFWSLLALAARNQQVFSYRTVESLTGVPRFGMANILGQIQNHCRDNNLPPLTCIVVAEDTGLPKEGFTGAKIEDIFREQSRVFVFDWAGQKAPFPLKDSSD